ncbi:MAG: NAD(+) diphosphatase [Porticoccaceae bacterium]|nr:NAD(+) diphosphatase [Porticoccaceae bacterium]
MTIPPSLNGFYASPVAINTDKRWIIAVIGGDILVASGANSTGPVIDSDATDLIKFFCERRIVLGQWQGRDCEVWELLPEAAATEGFTTIELRTLLMSVGDEEFSLACRAVQLLDWQNKHRFCGSCGQPNTVSGSEHALECKVCKISNYPRISPCIIVLVTRGDHCLLARNPSWPANRFSALAGFLEAGETAEQALHREVFEEVGVEINNIRYFGSQSWPYPGQLMLGFIADAVTDAITIDGIEIAEADWFRYDNLPGIIAPPTIMSGRLLQQYIDESTLTYG